MDNLKKEFNEIYINKIIPILKSLEPYRKKEHLKYILFEICMTIIFITSFIITVLLFITFDDKNINLFKIFYMVMGLPLTGYAIHFVWGKYEQNALSNIKRLLKDNYFPEILPLFGNLKYKELEIPSDLFTESELFSQFDKIERDDVFSGEYNNTWFHIEELELIQNDAVTYKGIVIVFPSNKTVQSKTIIATKTDTDKNNILPYTKQYIIIWGTTALCILFSIPTIMQADNLVAIGYLLVPIICVMFIIYYALIYKNKTKRFQEIKLEDIDFDKRFSVQSRNQIEARYLVAPAFMERMKGLQTAFGTKDIKCSFFENKVMFAIKTDQDVFEVGKFSRPLYDSKLIYQFIDELSAVYDMIDYFKLAEKTGL